MAHVSSVILPILYSHGICSYGLYSMAYLVMAYVVMAHVSSVILPISPRRPNAWLRSHCVMFRARMVKMMGTSMKYGWYELYSYLWRHYILRRGHFEYRHAHTRAIDMPSATPR